MTTAPTAPAGVSPTEAEQLLRLAGYDVDPRALNIALSAFQLDAGLPATGSLDPATSDELVRRFRPALDGTDRSTSVLNMGSALSTAPVTPWQIVEHLLNDPSHSRYGGGKGPAVLALGPVPGETRTVEEWLGAVRSLFVPQPVGQLDGKLVIAGLALYDDAVRDRLLHDGFLATMESEVDDFDSNLSAVGRAHRLGDAAPTVSDRATKEDALQRQPFARLLARQLRDEYDRTRAASDEADSFMVHLEGPWGSGKSTILNLLQQELERQSPPCLVARFDAWRHQRIGPPWWLLVKVVYRAALDTNREQPLPLRERAALWLENLQWRLRLAWRAFAAVGVASGVLIGLAVTGKLAGGNAVGVFAAAMTALTGAILSVRGFASALSVASPRGSDTFIRATRDPMNELRDRFRNLVQRITSEEQVNRPLVVFIDDLDRCRSDYVVSLLEGIQTILRDAPVAYVVAADRRWLYASYAEVYAGHEHAELDPGRPLGHLFLEKSFQLSATVPRLGPTQRSSFLQQLVAAGREPVPAASPVPAPLHAPAAQAELERRERAVDRLGSPRGEREAEHYLSRFAHLLEPNPRAIKRLLNAYRPAYAVEILEGRAGHDAAQKDQFVLWLILNLRWPLLADYLVECPDAADDLAAPGDAVGSAIGAESARPYLGRLARDEAVRRVCRGDGVGTKLDCSAVRRLLAETPLA